MPANHNFVVFFVMCATIFNCHLVHSFFAIGVANLNCRHSMKAIINVNTVDAALRRPSWFTK